MIWLAILAAGAARAASLDNLEVGGPFGSPLSTDGTALWWNPAGLAAMEGTRVNLEGAPTLATVTYDRVDPHGYGGRDTYELAGAVPFLGVATDVGVKNLGLGLALAVPIVRGGKVVDEIPVLDAWDQDAPVPPDGGFGRYALRQGRQQALYAIAGAAYDVADRVQLGASVAFVDSTWQARVDVQNLSSLHHTLGQDSPYADEAMLEDPRYSATLDYSPLKDQAVTFGAGARAVVIPDAVFVGVSYVHGVRLDHEGNVALHFSCPPESDTVGYYAVDSLGLCYASVDARGTIGYRLPSRVSASVQIKPVDRLTVEVLGGWVGWSAYTDFEIGVSEVEQRNEGIDPDAVALVEQDRLWARANRDSGWGGVDVKGEIGDTLLLGVRGIYDRSAIPDEALGPNNYDANDVLMTGLVAVRPHYTAQIGLSYTFHLLQTREVADSAFGVDLDRAPPMPPAQDRFFYPHTNGTYSGVIHRIGLGIRGEFGTERTKRIRDERRLRWETEEMLPERAPVLPPPVEDAPAEEAPVEDTPAEDTPAP